MLYILGIFITIFLSGILFTKKGRTSADTILALWLVGVGVHLFLYYMYFTKQSMSYPFLLGFEVPLPLIHGPFLYLYTRTLTGKKGKKIFNLLHFVPVLLVCVWELKFFALSGAEKIHVYQNEGVGFELITKVVFISIILSGVAYITLSLIGLRKHAYVIKQNFSYTEKVNLAWLRYLIYGILVIWIVIFFGVDKYIYLTAVIYIIFVGYFGIKQVGIFTQATNIAANYLVSNEATVVVNEPSVSTPLEMQPLATDYIKYGKSGLDETEASGLQKRLHALMADEKLFTDPELTLNALATKLNTSPNYVSQVINTKEGMSFYDFINNLRVIEFQQAVKLSANKNFTLLSIAHACGFNSKTSFNRNFRKVTGISPTEYLTQTGSGNIEEPIG